MITSLNSGHRGRPYTAALDNVVGAGNSLMVGVGTTLNPNAMMPQLAQMSAINGRITPLMRGISGQTTRQMNGLDGGTGLAALQAAYVAGKVNTMIVWELTNSIWSTTNTRSGAQAASDMRDFVLARLAEHSDWRIILMESLPRIQLVGSLPAGTTVASLNAEIIAANQILRDNHKAWGCVGFCPTRAPGTPFDVPDFTFATMDAVRVTRLGTSDLVSPWASTANDATGNHVHLNDDGYKFIANYVNMALRRAPA